MTFGRQKRLLLGALALLAPLPLPFNGVVAWPAVIGYWIGMAFFLRRASQDPPRWLPLWGMNVLGLVYLPVFFVDLTILSPGRIVQPALHLCLFALLIKLFALVRERDKWQAAMGVFFLFLAAMGTSVHPTIVLYLAAFVLLSLLLFTRFAFLHVLAGFGREDPALARIPLRGFLLFATLASLLLAVPLFALLPRVRAPFIAGRGAGTGTTLESVGFSDEVTLSSIGRIRSSREVALRMLAEGDAAIFEREMRLKAATFEVYEANRWRRSPEAGILPRRPGLRFQLTDREPESWIQVWLQPLNSDSLPLPVSSAVVEPRAPTLVRDRGGAVSLAFRPLEVTQYRVGLADGPVLTGLPPDPERDGTLDLAGVTPRISDAALRVMGQGVAGYRARRLEEHLAREYDYTLDFTGRSADNPIEDFLFRYRSGQCEYFASSMVLMLRSQGIPARLVTGFLGGEYNPFEGYTIVRDSNAHAWVEAWLPEEGGWVTFDPTPAAGRPGTAEQSTLDLFNQAWDFLLFRWDRYVLTFGLYDQVQIFGGLRSMWRRLTGFFRGDGEGPAPVAGPGEEPTGELVAAPAPSGGLADVPLPAALAFTALAAFAWLLYLRLRPPLTATAAYRRLRRRLGRRGAAVLESVPPLTLVRQAADRFPAAAEPAGRVVAFYLRESFGGQRLEDAERQELKAALEEAERRMRKAG